MIVTGGAGFIGSALARLAVAEGHHVMVTDKLTYAGNRSSLREIEASSRFLFRQADICDEAAMTAALREFEPDAVFHLAAESHVDRSITGAGEFVETNIVGTFRLLQAARGYWEDLPAVRREAFLPSFMSPPVRSMARLARPASFGKTRHTTRARPTPLARRPPIISRVRGATPMACRY